MGGGGRLAPVTGGSLGSYPKIYTEPVNHSVLDSIRQTSVAMSLFALLWSQGPNLLKRLRHVLFWRHHFCPSGPSVRPNVSPRPVCLSLCVLQSVCNVLSVCVSGANATRFSNRSPDLSSCIATQSCQSTPSHHVRFRVLLNINHSCCHSSDTQTTQSTET